MNSKRCQIIIILAVLLGFITLTFNVCQGDEQEDFFSPEHIMSRVRDMESLNLLKGLNLSPQQMKDLLMLLYDSRLLEKEVMLGYKADGIKADKKLDMLQELLYKDQGVDVPTEEAVWFALGTLYEHEYDRYIGMQKLVEKTYKILNQNQLRIISEYMPCIIPWSTVNAPDRIGQSGSIGKLEEMLDHMRTLEGAPYKEAKRNYLVELDWRLRIDRREDDKTRQILVKQIDKRLDEIHKLPDNEYQIRKRDLAQWVRPPDLEILPPRVGEDLNEYIEEYILNPSNIEYLQYQLKAQGYEYPVTEDIIDHIDFTTDDHQEDKDYEPDDV